MNSVCIVAIYARICPPQDARVNVSLRVGETFMRNIREKYLG